MTIEEIKDLRQMLGVSQEELAEKLGTSRQVVSSWETGISRPNKTYRAKLERLSGIRERNERDELLKELFSASMGLGRLHKKHPEVVSAEAHEELKTLNRSILRLMALFNPQI